MKKIQINLTDSEINAIIQCLQVLPSYNLLKSQTDLEFMYILTVSSVEKLKFHQQLNDKETFLVALAVDNAFKALRNELTANQEIITSLTPYLFTINKLHPLFVPVLNMTP